MSRLYEVNSGVLVNLDKVFVVRKVNYDGSPSIQLTTADGTSEYIKMTDEVVREVAYIALRDLI